MVKENRPFHFETIESALGDYDCRPSHGYRTAAIDESGLADHAGTVARRLRQEDIGDVDHRPRDHECSRKRDQVAERDLAQIHHRRQQRQVEGDDLGIGENDGESGAKEPYG